MNSSVRRALSGGCAILCATLLGMHARASEPLRTSQVSTPDGVLEGVISADGKVRTFKGIPYAAPPVGNLRWKAPQPVQPWTGVRKASEYGPRCMQARIFDDMVFHDAGPSEDCLHLNLWMPAEPATRKLPVMVWIHGGGFVAGASSEPRQDGGNLSKCGVLVVSMNYRMGIFGFFSHPELDKESGHDASGNYGLLDQVAALQWVKKNIALFGGDPENVTIFGESAGSFSVSALMASPLAQGLFQRAIGESGAYFGTTLQLVPREASEKSYLEFAQNALGATSLEALRAKPATELLETSTKQHKVEFEPNIDGYFLPEDVYATYAKGKQSHVSLLAGWNADEGDYHSFFEKDEPNAKNYAAHAKAAFGDKAAAFLKAYPGETDAEAKRSAQDLTGDQFIAYSTWKWIEMHQATAHVPIYRYQFDQAPPAADGSAGPRGAYHSAEIEFVFNVLSSKPLPWSPADRKLSDLMSIYWSNFAKTGNPNGPGLPQWPAFGKADGYKVMHLSTDSHSEPEHNRARYEFLDGMSQHK
jgi:para-nitrobenzyl esterase